MRYINLRFTYLLTYFTDRLGLVVGLGLVQLLQSSFVDFAVNNTRT